MRKDYNKPSVLRNNDKGSKTGELIDIDAVNTLL